MHFYYEIHFKKCRCTQVKIKIEYGNTVCNRPDTFQKFVKAHVEIFALKYPCDIDTDTS